MWDKIRWAEQHLIERLAWPVTVSAIQEVICSFPIATIFIMQQYSFYRWPRRRSSVNVRYTSRFKPLKSQFK